MTESRDVTPKTTEHNLNLIRIGKSEAEVTKKLRSRYCAVEANYREARSIKRPQSTKQLIVDTRQLTASGPIIEVNCPAMRVGVDSRLCARILVQFKGKVAIYFLRIRSSEASNVSQR